jgi:PAS domain S-box-containing protein
MRKDGSRLWVSGVMSLLRDESGLPRAYAKVMRDVTEAKLAGDALRESEGRLRVALEAAEMGTWLWRIATDEQILDDSLCQLMGLPAGDKITTLDNFLRAVHEDDRERVREEFERCRREGGGFDVEFRVVRPDGGVRWLKDQGKAFAGKQGTPLFITGACMDISDRKRMEEELHETDRKKNEFLALLAHELRNPLAPLRNGLQVMRLASGNEEAVARARAMMDRQLGHLVRLIDDLLDVARLSQNKLQLQRARVLLSDVLASAVETARPAIDAAGHQLTVSIPPDPVFLEADLTRLAQVFSNLLTNSAKYTPPGGHIWLTAERLDREVVVSVRDTGIGIPGEALPSIFDMFSQVDRSVERSTGGLGIGLALVKGLVEMHGGTVKAESAGVGKGSTFTVTFPVPAPLPRSAPVVPPQEDPTRIGPGRRILVVDDNRDGADSLAMMLRLLGNEVRTTNDGIKAIEQAEVFRPEIILMDVGMPRLNGLDATRRIREKEWGKQITIIALTGWSQDADRERTREAGCDGHLVKPVTLADLEKLLEESSRNR